MWMAKSHNWDLNSPTISLNVLYFSKMTMIFEGCSKFYFFAKTTDIPAPEQGAKTKVITLVIVRRMKV